MKSTVSVIIPTHNRAKFLMEALESVYSQTLKPFEIIVVDDGSTDNTQKALSESDFKVHYIYQKKSGPAAARNAGIAKASGDVIVFLDDDDLLLPKALELTVTHLENEIFQADIVFGLTMPVKNIKKEKGTLMYETIPPVWPERLIGGAVLRAGLFEKVGLFDESLALGQDLDWHMRAKEKQVCASFLSEVIHLYRLHDNNRSKKTSESQKFMLKVLKNSLSRRENKDGVALPFAS